MAKQQEEQSSATSQPRTKKQSSRHAGGYRNLGDKKMDKFQWGEVDDQTDEKEISDLIVPTTGKKKRRKKSTTQVEKETAETRFQIQSDRPRPAADLSLPSYGRTLFDDEDDFTFDFDKFEDDEAEEVIPAVSAPREKRKKASTKKVKMKPDRKEDRVDSAEKAEGANEQVSEKVPQKKQSRKHRSGKAASSKIADEPKKAAPGPEPANVVVDQKPEPEKTVPSPKIESDDSDDSNSSVHDRGMISPRRVRGLKRRAAIRLREFGLPEDQLAAILKTGEKSPVDVLFLLLESFLDLEQGKTSSDGPKTLFDSAPEPIPVEVAQESPETPRHQRKDKPVPRQQRPEPVPDARENRNESASSSRNTKAEKPERTEKPRSVMSDIDDTKPERSDRPVSVEIRKETEVQESESKEVPHFGDLHLSEEMVRTLKESGYEKPTPVQAGTIEHVMAGTDLIGQAKTGTGKTAAFAIPIIEQVGQCEPGDSPVCLIVVPTRELAVQVRDEIVKLSAHSDIITVACYGGKPIADQIKKMNRGVDIVVGTPGRVIDLVNRRALSFKTLRWVVLDEADRMLDIGFRPDIERILKQTPSTRQTLLFSATLPAPVVLLAKHYMKDPEQYDFSEENISSETIEQYYMTVDKERKFDALIQLIQREQPQQAIVFCRTKRAVDRVGTHLQKLFDGVSMIHGDLSQDARDRVMKNFREGKVRILVATDVVGRGIDVSGISHIINYDIPEFCDDYVHRVGRTGRMGREGVAYTLVTVQEGAELTRIEKRINQLLKRTELPGFEAYARPEEKLEEEKPVAKPVFGHNTRRIRRAL